MKAMMFEDGDKRFEQLWDALMLGSAWPVDGKPAQGKSKAETRREASLQRKCLAISEPSRGVDLSRRPANARSLKPGPQRLCVQPEDFTLLVHLCERFPWAGEQQMLLADFYDLLETAANGPDVNE